MRLYTGDAWRCMGRAVVTTWGLHGSGSRLRRGYRRMENGGARDRRNHTRRSKRDEDWEYFTERGVWRGFCKGSGLWRNDDGM